MYGEILNKILPNESVIGRFTGSKFGVLFGSANEIENIDYITDDDVIYINNWEEIIQVNKTKL